MELPLKMSPKTEKEIMKILCQQLLDQELITKDVCERVINRINKL